MSTALKALTATTGNRKDTWNTPNDVVIDVLEFFDGKLGLDPCADSADQPNVPAEMWFTEEDNGLSKEWDYSSVFMNHPYSQSRLWIPYAVNQHKKHGTEMLLLIKMDVSTKWWRVVSPYPMLAYNRRLKFGAGTSAAPFQSAMIYLGDRFDRFVNTFSKDGQIYYPINDSHHPQN